METRRVIAFGTFDLLHEGHRSYLAQAAALGDELLVCVACDQAVRWAKGREALGNEQQRRDAVAAVGCVSSAFVGGPVQGKEDYLNPIRRHQPDVICLGYDQAPEFSEWLETAVRSLPKPPRIVRAEAYRPEVYKTSLLRKKLEAYNT